MSRECWAGLVVVAALGLGAMPAHSQGDSRFGLVDVDLGDAENVEACVEQAKKFSRLMGSRFSGRFKGPEADRRDIAYGGHARERLDVFLPARRSAPAPIIVMVHGGGWCVGDKTLKAVTKNKTEHYVPKGFVFVSVNYPMVADGAKVPAQAESVARALAYVQQHAREWGGDERRIVTMGHSAGAHLVSLVNADARLRERMNIKPVLGVVSLDSGATNAVTQIRGMSAAKIKKRYLEAFGPDEAAWRAASPYHLIDRSASAWLGVCSSLRKDNPCAQTTELAQKAGALGVRAQVLSQGRKHGAINSDLGLPGDYTDAVDEFIASLDPSLRAVLGR